MVVLCHIRNGRCHIRNTGCHILNRHLFLCGATTWDAISNILFATIYAYSDTVIVDSYSFYA